MTILQTVRSRFSDRPTPESAPSEASPGATANPAEQPALPFDGYDRLKEMDVVHALREHSQVELEAVESYERSHQNRPAVLDKLRFMRQGEPLPGYDALDIRGIQRALEQADLETVKKVRGYERKFANRPEVLEEVTRRHHERLAGEPTAVPTTYQPMGSSSQ